MKLLFTLILSFFIISSWRIIELDTFGRLYRQHDVAYSVQQTADGGFIIGTDNGILKANNEGRMEWQVFAAQAKIIQSQDSMYLAGFIKKIPNSSLFGLQVNQYDINGDLFLDKTIMESADIILYDFIQSMDEGYVFLSMEQGKQPSLIKTNSLFEIEWQKSFQSSAGFFREPHFIQTLDSGFIGIGANGELTKFDNFGDTLWTNYQTPHNYYLVGERSDSSLILVGNNVIGLFDKFGSLINETSADIVMPKKIIIDDENEVIYLIGNSILKMDFDYNILWQNNTNEFSFEDITLLTENSLVAVGQYTDNQFSNAFLLKMTPQGTYEYLMLGQPQEDQLLQVLQPIAIRWASTFSEALNIKYSVDNGQNWNVIVNNYPAGDNVYNWHTPGLETDQFLIRIERSGNLYWYDQFDVPVTLVRKNYDYITTDKVLMWFGNNGDGSHDPNTGGNGFYWPGGVNGQQSAIYEDGLCWAGWVGDSVRASGSTHRHGLQPGNILADGQPADPSDTRFGIWRATPGWQSLSDGPEKDRLDYDWNNWPVDLGAPWQDMDSDGQYDPLTDQPKIPGDDLFWMVMNDKGILDSSYISQHMWGTDPIGLEVQLSVYAYNENILKNVIFKKYKILNKGQNFVDSMYFSYWSDPDLGSAGDDYAGCDSTLGLAYCYNDDNYDAMYSQPPAVGYVLLQGPVIPGDVSDEAYAFENWIPQMKNLPVTSFMPYINSHDQFKDPASGMYEGALQYYNNMTGKLYNGSNIINPVSGKVTHFALNGDPVADSGWYEGSGWPDGPRSGDRRMIMNSGPFDFAPGDSQEIVIAVLIARGDDHLDSITELKKTAQVVKEFYYTGNLPLAIEEQDNLTAPNKFSLKQNYPNPFNPTTIINYELGITNYVKLIVYDVLGREVKILVNKRQPAGQYHVNFDASRLASGIYYYRLLVGAHYNAPVQTRKMLLLR